MSKNSSLPALILSVLGLCCAVVSLVLVLSRPAATLAQGKIDAYIYDKKQMELAAANGLRGVRILDQTLGEKTKIALGISGASAIPDLEKQVNRFIKEVKQNGTLDDLYARWVIQGDYSMPWSYIKDGKNVGYDIDLVVRFCRERGYALELGDVDFAGRIPAVQSGKYDFTTDMNVTPEREEQVLFSSPTAHGGIVLAVPSSDLTPATSGGVNGVYQSLDELAGKRIGVITGSIHDGLVAERLPTAQRVYFTVPSDMLAALKAGKIDAFVLPEASAIFMRYEDGSITWLDESLQDGDVGFAFPKTEEGRALCGRFSEYIRAIQADGTLAELTDKWFRADESVKTMIDYTALPATNGTLHMATVGIQVPFNYVRDNRIVGFDIELAARFCEEAGYCLQVEQMNFDGILASVQSEKCDFAGACLVITEERKEQVDFSEPYYLNSVVAIVLDGATAGNGESFFDSVKSSFEKTFLRENRWKLFLEGIGTTMLITVLSILFGTALGFPVYMLCRNGNENAELLKDVSITVNDGDVIAVIGPSGTGKSTLLRCIHLLEKPTDGQIYLGLK